jgi:hypothetical protein
VIEIKENKVWSCQTKYYFCSPVFEALWLSDSFEKPDRVRLTENVLEGWVSG